MIDLRHRIDGTVAWANLPPDVQSAIGAAAIELVAAWAGLDAAFDDDPAATSASRAFEAADSLCSDRLHIAVEEHVRRIDPEQPPLPASLGRVCHRCGCSEHDPCDLQDRAWQESDLCSTCRPPASSIVG